MAGCRHGSRSEESAWAPQHRGVYHTWWDIWSVFLYNRRFRTPTSLLFKPLLRKFFVIRWALVLAAFPLCSSSSRKLRSLPSCSPLGWEQLWGCPLRTLDAAKPGFSLSVNDICGTKAVPREEGVVAVNRGLPARTVWRRVFDSLTLP